MEEEVWKVYPDYPFIEASNLGRIRTVDRYVPGKRRSKRLIKGRVLKQRINNRGYMYVQFRVNGKKIFPYVHRIVATCFLPNPNNYPEINHIDCDPTNNRLDNLEWCTHEYNTAYREKYGKALGRPVIAINPETSEVFWFESQHEATRYLSVCTSSINEVVKGKRHKAGGCWFCDADENAVDKTKVKFGDEVANKVEKLMRENQKFQKHKN